MNLLIVDEVKYVSCTVIHAFFIILYQCAKCVPMIILRHDDDESYHPSGDESNSEEDTIDDLGKLKTKLSMHLTTFKL